MSLPCSLFSATTLGPTAVVTPLRARPPVGLRCHIRHLAEALLDPPRRELRAHVDFIVLLRSVVVTTLAQKVRGLRSPCLVFGLAPYSAVDCVDCVDCSAVSIGRGGPEDRPRLYLGPHRCGL